ncbi:MAG: hypothetical protein AAGI53_01375 [Planctomycetota bacterium]
MFAEACSDIVNFGSPPTPATGPYATSATPQAMYPIRNQTFGEITPTDLA